MSVYFILIFQLFHHKYPYSSSCNSINITSFHSLCTFRDHSNTSSWLFLSRSLQFHSGYSNPFFYNVRSYVTSLQQKTCFLTTSSLISFSHSVKGSFNFTRCILVLVLWKKHCRNTVKWLALGLTPTYRNHDETDIEAKCSLSDNFC